MALIEAKTLAELRNYQLSKWQELEPNINVNPDSMVYMDASVIAEILYFLQQDAITLANNAFLAYAVGDELTNLGNDRGIERKAAVKSEGEVIFSRESLAAADYVIPLGTLISTQPDVNGVVKAFQTTEEATLYGTITAPTGLNTSLSATGGAIGAGTYNYKVTAVTADDKETEASSLVARVVGSGTTNKITVTWNAVARAASYNVYLDESGTYHLIGRVSTPTFEDTVGSTPESIEPPSTNETGNLEVTVPVESTAGGDLYNVSPNTITAFISKPLGIEAVINDEGTTGGADEESDDTYRERIRDSLSGAVSKVTVAGYRTTAESVSGVASATVTIAEGGERRNEISVYIVASGGNGVPSSELIALVQAELDLDENRAVCDDITVIAPETLAVDVDITLTDYESSSFTEEEIEEAIQAAIEAFLKTVDVGSVVRVVDLADVIHATEGVTDFILNAPTENVDLEINEMAILGTFNMANPSSSVSPSISPSSSTSPSASVSPSASGSPSSSESPSVSPSSSVSPSASQSPSASVSPSSSVSPSVSPSASVSPSSSASPSL